MERNKVREKYKWDLEVIYKNREEFLKEYNQLTEIIEGFKEYQKNMLDGPLNIYNTLKESFKIERILDKLSSYTSLLCDLDTSNNNNEELSEQVSNLYDLYSKNAYFIVPYLLKKEYSDFEQYYIKEPKLKKYELIIKRVFRYKDYTLSEKEEKLLSNITKMTNNNYKTYELFKDCDLSLGFIKNEKGKKVQLTDSNYSLYIESINRDVRKNTFFTLFDSYKKYKNTFSSLLTGNIKESSTLSKIKGYGSSLEAALFGDEIDTNVYNNLIDTVSSNLNILYKFYDLKKQQLNIEEMHIYDIYAPITNGVDRSYKYKNAEKKVLEVLSIFGKEYITTLKDGIKKRWIDVYPSNAKRTGGYSGGSYDTYPYILLNYQNKYDDMSTLAHEIGHSMHSYYSRKYNDYEYSNYTIFVAEVASTVNELLLAKNILKNTNDINEKKYILERLMNLFRATIFRQTMFAEFEKKLYNEIDNDNVLTADKISDIYLDLNKKYFGNDVIIDEVIKYEWIRIPHFYYNFYVYKYATGLSAACYIVNNILNRGEEYISKYIDFLKCGSSKSPIDSLLLAEVDLRDKKVIEVAIKMFGDIIEEYKNL